MDYTESLVIDHAEVWPMHVVVLCPRRPSIRFYADDVPAMRQVVARAMAGLEHHVLVFPPCMFVVTDVRQAHAREVLPWA